MSHARNQTRRLETRDSSSSNAARPTSATRSSAACAISSSLSSRLIRAGFAGDYHSAFHGRGIEFAQVREYMPGDDIRTIDWNVTARSGVPHVKEFIEERDLTVLIAVDVSGSMALRLRRLAQVRHRGGAGGGVRVLRRRELRSRRAAALLRQRAHVHPAAARAHARAGDRARGGRRGDARRERRGRPRERDAFPRARGRRSARWCSSSPTFSTSRSSGR